MDYKRDLDVEGVSNGRIYKVLINLRRLAEKLEELSLVDASESDVKDLVAWVQGRDLAESTKSGYKQVLKQFFKWLNDGELDRNVLHLMIEITLS